MEEKKKIEGKEWTKKELWTFKGLTATEAEWEG